ncbi:RidA family protein [Streptomyces sp. NPDC045369]|uniref:RidA family protein n=1 Tax=Streptomyces sp. NPDC045369 TaxID=3155732 RepID=UPI0033CFC104
MRSPHLCSSKGTPHDSPHRTGRRLRPSGPAPPDIRPGRPPTGVPQRPGGLGRGGPRRGEGDHAAQATQVARRIDRLLDALGAQRQDIVKETIYVVNHEPHLTPGILTALHGSPPPSSTLVGVAKLFAPQFLVEVECVVALPGGERERAR